MTESLSQRVQAVLENKGDGGWMVVGGGWMVVGWWLLGGWMVVVGWLMVVVEGWLDGG